MTDEPRAMKCCPFCGNPVKAGMTLTTCPACNAAHHYACWRDQGGCAVAGCSENPKREAIPQAAQATSSSVTRPIAAPSARPAPPVDDASFEYSTLDPELERLLAEIYLRLREERFVDVATRLEEAKRLAADHPAVLEAEGDLLFAQGKARQAEALYGRALKADAKNVLLEEKYATAVMKVHEPEILAHAVSVPDDSPWTNRVPRPPLASGVLSAIVPGIGQWYNGELLKGAIGLICSVIFVITQWWTISQYLYDIKKLGSPFEITALTQRLTQGGNLIFLFLYAALVIYAVIDAVLVAKASQSLPKLYTHDPAAQKPELKP